MIAPSYGNNGKRKSFWRCVVDFDVNEPRLDSWYARSLIFYISTVVSRACCCNLRVHRRHRFKYFRISFFALVEDNRIDAWSKLRNDRTIMG